MKNYYNSVAIKPVIKYYLILMIFMLVFGFALTIQDIGSDYYWGSLELMIVMAVLMPAIIMTLSFFMSRKQALIIDSQNQELKIIVKPLNLVFKKPETELILDPTQKIEVRTIRGRRFNRISEHYVSKATQVVTFTQGDRTIFFVCSELNPYGARETIEFLSNYFSVNVLEVDKKGFGQFELTASANSYQADSNVANEQIAKDKSRTKKIIVSIILVLGLIAVIRIGYNIYKFSGCDLYYDDICILGDNAVDLDLGSEEQIPIK